MEGHTAQPSSPATTDVACTRIARFSVWEVRSSTEGDSTRESCHLLIEFDTVEAFWSIWAALPPLSRLFGTGADVPRKGVAHTSAGTSPDAVDGAIVVYNVIGYAVFRAGVAPVWEHTGNRDGGEWSARRGVCPFV